MNLIFRVDSTAQRGAGHGMRCYALAEKAVERGHNVSFIGAYSGFPWFVEKLNQLGINIVETSEQQKIKKEIEKLNPDFVIVDSYLISNDWVKELKKNYKILAIVDGENQFTDANIFLDQNVENWSSNFKENPDSLYLRGSKFTLIRNEISQIRDKNFAEKINPRELNIIVLTGGSDLEGASIKFAQLLQKLQTKQPWKATFITKETHHQEILRYTQEGREFLAKEPTNLLGEMLTGVDLALTLGGTSTWELATAAIPLCVACAADNQEMSLLTVNKLGIGISLGWISDEIFLGDKNVEKLTQIIDDREFRRSFKIQSYEKFDGLGCSRILETLENYSSS